MAHESNKDASINNVGGIPAHFNGVFRCGPRTDLGDAIGQRGFEATRQHGSLEGIGRIKCVDIFESHGESCLSDTCRDDTATR